MKKHIITIAGKLGAGKSSAGKKAASALNYKHYSSGDFMREIAKDRGITLAELSSIAESDPSIDQEIDAYVKKTGEEKDIIIDSRLAYHWIPDSFKVFLELPPQIAAQRILNDQLNNPNRAHEHREKPTSVEEVIQSAKTRSESERKRYSELYGIKDYTDPTNFDLVIDTEKNNLEQVTQIILEKYNEWLNN